MKRRFGARPNVAHKGTGFNRGMGNAVWISAICEKYFQDSVIIRSIRLAESGMKWSLTAWHQRFVYVGALFNQEAAKLRMPMKDCSIKVKIVAKRPNIFTVHKKKLDCADIAVVSTPFDHGYSGTVFRARGSAGFDELEYEISFTI